jgi:hypothetical protein
MRCAMRDVTNRGAGDSVFNIGRATVEDLTFKNHDGRLTHDPTLAVKLPEITPGTSSAIVTADPRNSTTSSPSSPTST